MEQPAASSVHHIAGDLTIHAPDVGARWNGMIQPGSANAFDFAEIGRVDSAGIAMLIAWKRYAQANNATVSFVNLPPQALRLVGMYELEGLLLDQAAPAKEQDPAN